MAQQTFGIGTIPLVLKVGERVTVITSAGCAGTISVPGEAVSQTITAGTLYDFGGYASQREVVLAITAGTVTVNLNADGSQYWTQAQADGLQALMLGDWTPILVYSGVWASRPTSGIAVNARAWITDVGQSGAMFLWDGTYWRPTAPVTLMTIVAPLTKVDDDTAQGNLLTQNLPANLWVPGQRLELFTKWQRNGASAATVTLKVTMGGTNLISTSALAAAGIYRSYSRFQSRTMNSQILDFTGGQTWGYAAGGSWGIVSLDQTTALTVQASATWGIAGGGTSSAVLHQFDLVLQP